MKSYRIALHYCRPSRHGGIECKIEIMNLDAINEDEAEKEALIIGVSDPAYLYMSMVETSRIFNGGFGIII